MVKGYYKHLYWQYKFAFLPKICNVSKKRIWLTHAYRATIIWTGPGDPIEEHIWVHPHEYLILKLKGKV